MEYEVTAVENPNSVLLGHESITAIGNHRHGWSISTASAILRIQKKREVFFVKDLLSDERVYLAAVDDKYGRTTLRGISGGRATNTLLALRPLRECALID